MKKLRLLPYKLGSNSAKALAGVLNGLRVRPNGTYRPAPNHLVVNWGCAAKPAWWRGGLNDPSAVGRSSNKLVTFNVLKAAGVSIPDFTTDIAVAKAWVANEDVVVGRKILNGHSGIGCEVYTAGAVVGPCPLYTKHLRHKREFRIHVFKGEVIDQVEKLRKRDVADRDSWIRNHDNGWVFARGGGPIPDGVRLEAVRAVAALGLDFGAADVGYREREGKAFVFEVNTAPGIEGHTIESYARAIQKEMLL